MTSSTIAPKRAAPRHDAREARGASVIMEHDDRERPRPRAPFPGVHEEIPSDHGTASVQPPRNQEVCRTAQTAAEDRVKISALPTTALVLSSNGRASMFKLVATM